MAKRKKKEPKDTPVDQPTTTYSDDETVVLPPPSVAEKAHEELQRYGRGECGLAEAVVLAACEFVRMERKLSTHGSVRHTAARKRLIDAVQELQRG